MSVHPRPVVVIAGSRHVCPIDWELDWLARGIVRRGVVALLHGDAPNTDRFVAGFVERTLGIRTFPFPYRSELGAAGGPARNAAMARRAAARPGSFCVLFPGGDGTASMRREAERAGLPVHLSPSQWRWDGGSVA